MKIRLIWIVIAAVFLLLACEKNKTEPVKPITGMIYFPMADSTLWIYQVDSMAYNSFSGKTLIDTFTYWVKEVIVEDLSTQKDEISKRVERFISHDSGKVWNFDRNFSLIKNSAQAIRHDNNLMEIKLSFPMVEFKIWNGNSMNNRGSQDYLYEYLDRSFTIFGQLKDSAVSVLQRNVKNQIRDHVVREIYLPKLGMVAKESIDLEYKDLERTKSDGKAVKYTLIGFNEK